jgi:F0F1-type ATP synthase membrane subunit b/b'
MSIAFWVGLSTAVFLLIVAMKSYKIVNFYFSKQQDDIKLKLNEAESLYQKAHQFYEEYRERMEMLEIEADKILGNAHEESQNIVNSAESMVAKMVIKKQQELSQHLHNYEFQLKNKILAQYADVIADDLYKKSSVNRMISN